MTTENLGRRFLITQFLNQNNVERSNGTAFQSAEEQNCQLKIPHEIK